MQDKFQYVTVDTILAKYQRDFRGLDIGESDAIEWIGEALGFMKYASASEEAIAFIEVKNYQATLPYGLHYIVQIARSNKWTSEEPESCTAATLLGDIIAPVTPDCLDCDIEPSTLVLVDCQGTIIGDQEVAYYRPYFDLQYEYLGWAQSKACNESFTPVRLANHSFFNSLVCKTEETEGVYRGGRDEYTIVGDQLRFNFAEGFIALAYIRQRIDVTTGYPMIPDDESAKAAITYYLGWKMKENEAWNHREGASQLADRAEMRWLKYIKQFKNKAKMPWGIDEYQNLADQGNYLIPRRNRYYGFFGNLGTSENRVFNDPQNKNKHSN